MDAEIKVPCTENPDLSNAVFVKPGVRQSVALGTLDTAKKSSLLIYSQLGRERSFTVVSDN